MKYSPLVLLAAFLTVSSSLFAQQPISYPAHYPPQHHTANYGYGSGYGPIIQPVEPAWTQHIIPKKDRNVDFKTVAKGAHVEHRFVIKNPFEETLRIDSVTSSCSCTSISIEGNKNVLDTYDETVIIAHYRTDLFEGPKNATITVVIDKPYRAEFQLNVRGDTRSDLTISPNSLRLDKVKEGEEASRTLTVTYRGPASNWKIIDFKSDSEFLSGEVLETKVQLGQITTKIKISISPEAPSGELSERIYLITNDSAHRREIPVTVQATIGTVVRIAPGQVFFGNLKPGEPSPTKTVVVRGTEPFRITGNRAGNPTVKNQINPPTTRIPAT